MQIELTETELFIIIAALETAKIGKAEWAIEVNNELQDKLRSWICPFEVTLSHE